MITLPNNDFYKGFVLKRWADEEFTLRHVQSKVELSCIKEVGEWVCSIPLGPMTSTTQAAAVDEAVLIARSLKNHLQHIGVISRNGGG